MNRATLELLKLIVANDEKPIKQDDIERLKLILNSCPNEELVDALFLLSNRFVSALNAAREQFILIAITELDVHPHTAEQLNLPTLLGSLFGAGLPDVCGTKICDGCAFKQGSPANQSPSTQTDVLWCLESGERFYCHEFEDEDEKKICFGFLKAVKLASNDWLINQNSLEVKA